MAMCLTSKSRRTEDEGRPHHGSNCEIDWGDGNARPSPGFEEGNHGIDLPKWLDGYSVGTGRHVRELGPD